MTALVLFDRDGTLIRDVPYNGVANLVEPMPTAPEAVALLRANGVRIGVITNQSAIGLGMITETDLQDVHDRLEVLLGRMDVWQVCPHAPGDGCPCRKPSPLMVHRAAEAMQVHPHEVAVVGDIGTDVDAAVSAGARSVLVPNAHTPAQDIAAAPMVAPTLLAAVHALGIGGTRGRP